MNFNKELICTQYVIEELQVDNEYTAGSDNDETIVISECIDKKGNKAYSVHTEVDGLADVLGEQIFFETLEKAKQHAHVIK